MQKLESIYSYDCKKVKYNPNIIVKIKLILVWLKLFMTILECAQETETPDLSKTIVLTKGIWRGLKVVIMQGGQIRPISWLGDSLWWKKLQKNLKKKKISEAINKIIPYFIDTVTKKVWCPWKVLSRCTSRHHKKDTKELIKQLIIKGK